MKHKKILDGMGEEELKETLIGEALIKQVFKLSDSSKIAGCIIQSGKVTSKSFVKVFRDEQGYLRWKYIKFKA